MGNRGLFENVIFILAMAFIVIFGMVWVYDSFLSEADTLSAQEHIERWRVVSEDPSFKMLGAEDRIETILTCIVNGADYRPAQELVHGLLVDAYSDIYAKGFVDCQETCEEHIEQIHLVYSVMDN